MLKLLFLLQITLFAIQSSLAELDSFEESDIHFIHLTNTGEDTRECWVPPTPQNNEGYYEVLEEGTLSYKLIIKKNDQKGIILELHEFNIFHATDDCLKFIMIYGQRAFPVYDVLRNLKISTHTLIPENKFEDGREVFKVLDLPNGFLYLNNQDYSDSKLIFGKLPNLEELLEFNVQAVFNLRQWQNYNAHISSRKGH